MSDVDTSAEAVELFILIQISDIASSVGLPVTEDDKDTMVGVAAMLRALLSERDALTAQLAEARDSALEEAEKAVIGEYLEGESETPDDAAYDRAIADAVIAVRALKTQTQET